MTDDICGAECLDGSECHHPAGSCPVPSHSGDTDENPQGRTTELEKNPEITDLVAGELQNNATVPEACAEANISPRQYHDWRRRGEGEDAPEPFSEFRKETGRARKRASKVRRRELWEEAKDAGDVRTMYKLYHDQHGDTFDEEGGDGDAAEGIPLVVPETAQPDP